MERFHIIYLEPQLAAYLVTKTNFVQKKQCIRWATNSIERFFRLNISYSDALTVKFLLYVFLTFYTYFYFCFCAFIYAFFDEWYSLFNYGW